MDNDQRSKKYEILRDEILNYIKENHLEPGDKLPTVTEIIDKWNFSYATVNRTLIELEKEDLITKHQGKGLFVKRNEPLHQSKQVVLLIPAPYSEHKIFMNILSGVRTVLEKSNIGLLVSISNMSHQKEKETIEMLISKKINGIIIFMERNYRNDFSHIAELKQNNFPFVLIDRYIPELETDFVVINNKDTMFRICSYLKYNRNCNIIYFISDNTEPSNITSSQEKINGFKNAYKLLFGKDVDKLLTLDELVEKIDEICEVNQNVGISFNHDEMINEFLGKLKEANKSLPQNTHLFGYNNIYDKPMYPTVEQFNEEIGKKAAKILINKITNPKNRDIVQYRVEPKLILPNENGEFLMEQ